MLELPEEGQYHCKIFFFFLSLDFFLLTGNFMKNLPEEKNAVLSSISLGILKQFVFCSFNLAKK